ncbi:MAG: helix-hairpin-helix domain-containing protein, partial [Verrucomicrobiae bacterium]|nr:helix-hairpin-helix domain-containing protein [Verrucomicrobiae bacterium]
RLDSMRAARERPEAPMDNVPAALETAAGRVDLNRADAAALTTLPGIGPGKAARILAYREKHGPFRMTRELLRVRGIGPATLEKLAPLVTVGGE